MNTNTKRIAFGGILLALFIVLMYVDAVFPLLDRSFLLLSGLFVMTAIVEYNIKYGAFFYISAVLLGILIIPEKSGITLFAAFFGLYPLAKFFEDRISNRVLRIIIKLVTGDILLIIAYFIIVLLGFLTAIVPENIDIKSLSTTIIFGLLIVYQIAILVYDYFLSLYERYYNNKLKRLFRGLVN